MVLVPSTMLPLGTPAPAFSLPNVVDGQAVSLTDFEDQPLLVMFICNHCPYVKHVAPEIAKLAKEYQGKGVAVVAISANDVSAYPDDSPEAMKDEHATRGYTFPYLYDESQSVAKAYKAACTPDFYLFDKSHLLVYRGQLDKTRPKRGETPNGEDLRAALDRLLAGEPVVADQIPSTGCNIKWKVGREPEYFAT